MFSRYDRIGLFIGVVLSIFIVNHYYPLILSFTGIKWVALTLTGILFLIVVGIINVLFTLLDIKQ
jgi:hypothetical protein